MMDEPQEENLIRSRVKYEPPADGSNMARELLEAFKRHSNKTLLVDTESQQQWTGARLLDAAGRIATGLVERVGVRPNDVIMTICEHSAHEILLAIGTVLSGGAFYGSSPQDGYSEAKVLCELVKPDVLVVASGWHNNAIALRQELNLHKMVIIWSDNPLRSKGCISGHPATLTNGISLTNGGPNLLSTTSHSHSHQHQDHNDHFYQTAKTTASSIVVDENNNPTIETTNEQHATSGQYARLVQQDRVVLLDELLEGPLDLALVESIANEGIVADQHVLTYMLTSGSTGRPKVVPSTHEELVHGLYSMASACKFPFDSAQERGPNGQLKSQRAPLMPFGPNEIVSGDLPLDHGAGLNTMFLALFLGAKYVAMPSFNEHAFWQAVNDYKITVSLSSTTFSYKLLIYLKSLIDSNETHRYDLSSIRYIACAGAKMAFIDLVNEVRRNYKHIKVAQCYGATEIGFISMLHQDDCDKYLHSTGYLFPGLLAKVVDRDSATPLGPNQRGELLLWARSKFKGYCCHAEEDADELFAKCHEPNGRFYRTGDQAHVDEEGRIYVHGRFKDTLYLMGDWKILPAELEDIIQEHPLVEMCAVVGIPDPNLPGCHAPRAFVKLVGQIDPLAERHLAELWARRGAGADQSIGEHIYNWVAERTAKPKHLTGGVRILDDLPRVGLLNKIDRKALKSIE